MPIDGRAVTTITASNLATVTFMIIRPCSGWKPAGTWCGWAAC
jgi:hypothetical protein